MAEAVFAAKHEAAVHEVEKWLTDLGLDLVRLSSDELRQYRRVSPVGGWRFKCDFAGNERSLDLLVGPTFPFRGARVALVDRPPFLTWPHVEHDGLLCAVSEHANFDPDDPAGGVIRLIEQVRILLERLSGGHASEEFRDEVLSYWANRVNYSGPPLVSLVSPDRPAGPIRAWRSKELAVLADNENELIDWLTNRFGRLPKRMRKTTPGLLIKLERALLPSEFPESREDVLELARSAGVTESLEQAAQAVPPQVDVMLLMTTSSGPALVDIVMPRPAKRGGRDPLYKGFRPTGISPQRLAARYLRNGPVFRASVERVDASWVHGRGKDRRQSVLRDSTAVIVGCGSVGAPVAVQLAQAGVARLVLVDPDAMKSANFGRHPLGMPALGDPKPEALAARLRRDFPHIQIEACSCRVEHLMSERSGFLDMADVIVSTTADWATERLLDEWQSERGGPPIVYGWTEPHGCAGHAVAILSSGIAFRDGFDGTGGGRVEVTKWPDGATIAREPACGAVYQPYGPVELQYITAMVGETAMDVLLDRVPSSLHRIWAGSHRLLQDAGGTWSRDWQRLGGPGWEVGGRKIELPWGRECTAGALAA